MRESWTMAPASLSERDSMYAAFEHETKVERAGKPVRACRFIIERTRRPGATLPEAVMERPGREEVKPMRLSGMEVVLLVSSSEVEWVTMAFWKMER